MTDWQAVTLRLHPQRPPNSRSALCTTSPSTPTTSSLWMMVRVHPAAHLPSPAELLSRHASLLLLSLLTTDLICPETLPEHRWLWQEMLAHTVSFSAYCTFASLLPDMRPCQSQASRAGWMTQQISPSWIVWPGGTAPRSWSHPIAAPLSMSTSSASTGTMCRPKSQSTRPSLVPAAYSRVRCAQHFTHRQCLCRIPAWMCTNFLGLQSVPLT